MVNNILAININRRSMLPLMLVALTFLCLFYLYTSNILFLKKGIVSINNSKSNNEIVSKDELDKIFENDEESISNENDSESDEKNYQSSIEEKFLEQEFSGPNDEIVEEIPTEGERSEEIDILPDIVKSEEIDDELEDVKSEEETSLEADKSVETDLEVNDKPLAEASKETDLDQNYNTDQVNEAPPNSLPIEVATDKVAFDEVSSSEENSSNDQHDDYVPPPNDKNSDDDNSEASVYHDNDDYIAG